MLWEVGYSTCSPAPLAQNSSIDECVGATSHSSEVESQAMATGNICHHRAVRVSHCSPESGTWESAFGLNLEPHKPCTAHPFPMSLSLASEPIIWLTSYVCHPACTTSPIIAGSLLLGTTQHQLHPCEVHSPPNGDSALPMKNVPRHLQPCGRTYALDSQLVSLFPNNYI